MNNNSFTCFSDLLNEVPKWLADFEELTQSIEKWRLKHPPGQCSQPVTRLREASSTESLRPMDSHPANKQKSAASRSIAARSQHGHRPTSSRKIAVIHYDASIQKQIEALVRAIGNGRGCVRKGKITARVASHPTFSRDSVRERSRLDDTRQEEIWQDMTAASDLRKRSSSAKDKDDLADSGDGPTKSLNDIESALSDSQMLCEHIAHQILRDGDCGDDLEIVKNCFQDILRISSKELEKKRDEERVSIDQEVVKKQRFEDVSIAFQGSFSAGMIIPSLDVDDSDDPDELHSFTMPPRFSGLPRMAAC